MRFQGPPLAHIDVLIAEDDADARRVVRFVLERAGYRCAEARDGLEAEFIPAAQAYTEDGRRLTLLSGALTPWGVRLLGAGSLLGQKVRVFLPGCGARYPDGFLVRILWTCPAGGGLVENGGAFLPQGGWR